MRISDCPREMRQFESFQSHKQCSGGLNVYIQIQRHVQVAELRVVVAVDRQHRFGTVVILPRHDCGEKILAWPLHHDCLAYRAIP